MFRAWLSSINHVYRYLNNVYNVMYMLYILNFFQNSMFYTLSLYFLFPYFLFCTHVAYFITSFMNLIYCFPNSCLNLINLLLNDDIILVDVWIVFVSLLRQHLNLINHCYVVKCFVMLIKINQIISSGMQPIFLTIT